MTGDGGGALAAMRHRDFALFFSAALVSNTGTWMQTITVPFVLDQLTHSTVWVGLGALGTFFPATVVGPLAGSLADRYSRRTVLLVSQVVMMASALALWAVWVGGTSSPASRTSAPSEPWRGTERAQERSSDPATSTPFDVARR